MRLIGSEIAIERGGRRLFANLSFALEAGQALIVTGPNGAGKSSLLRAIAGFLPLAAGHFNLAGGDAGLRLGEQAHYLGHADALKGPLTAGENLEFWAGFLGAPASHATIPGALAQVGLSRVGNFPVNALSAGQKRRVALARLLVAPRPIWLLDEPSTGLDVAAQAQVAGLMGAHLSGGGIIVAATHLDLGLAGARELPLSGAQLAAA